MRPADLTDYLQLRRLVENPWQVLRFRKTQAPGQTLEVRFLDAPPLYVRGGTSDFHMFHRIFLRDEYRTRPAGLRDLQCVVDLGANVGMFSTFASRLSRRVLAFEPLPANFEQLQRNVGTRPNVTLLRQAVSGAPGVLRIYRPAHPKLGGTPSVYREGNQLLTDEFDEAPATTLDAVFDEHGVDRCDLLKIDVEGSEYEILHAASDVTLGRVQRIHGEYHDVRADDPRTRIEAFAAWLRSKGFRVDVAAHPKKPNHGMFFAARG